MLLLAEASTPRWRKDVCDFYVTADPMLYEPLQRSVRIHGVITSIRMEYLMWDVLAEIASDQKCTTNALIAKLHDELTAYRGEASNFTSFLRVTCVRHLKRSRTPDLDEGAAERRLPGNLDESLLRH
jgi:predicted DNA-binding ribbon-helix-helix protein